MKFTRRHLLEYTDVEDNVIRNVKVLGLESLNRRRYSPKAIREASQLYEGVPVNVDHPNPKNPREQRKINDRIGKIVNVRIAESGDLYGDLVLLKSHPLTGRILEAANNPELNDLFSLSHNAFGDGPVGRDGVRVIEHIAEVQSVDLVLDGATNKSLFESRQPRGKKMKFRQLLESLTTDRRLSTKFRRSLLEMPGMDMDEEMDPAMDAEIEPVMEEGEEDMVADPMSALADGFNQAGMAIFQDASMELKEKVKKLKELLQAQEKLMGSSTQETYDEAEDRDEDEKPVKESSIFNDPEYKPTKSGGDNKKGIRESRDLCELAGVTPHDSLLESLTYMPREAQMSHLKWLREELRERRHNRFTTGNPKRNGEWFEKADDLRG